MGQADRVNKPNTSWGDTAGKPKPNLVDTTLSSGIINTGKLNRVVDKDVIEFSDFEMFIKDYMLLMLGHPVVTVELHDAHLKLCMDKALSRMEYYAPYFATQYATFMTSGDINGYELPQHIVDGIEYAVYKKTLLSVAANNGSLEQDILIKYFQENFLFRNYDVGELYLLQAQMEQVRKVLGREGSWRIVDHSKLFLYPAPKGEREEVIIMYRTLNSDTMPHYILSWIQDYATAHAKEILGNIRGKFTQISSPDGGVKLDGDTLRTMAKEEKILLEEKILTELSDIPAITLY